MNAKDLKGGDIQYGGELHYDKALFLLTERVERIISEIEKDGQNLSMKYVVRLLKQALEDVEERACML